MPSKWEIQEVLLQSKCWKDQNWAVQRSLVEWMAQRLKKYLDKSEKILKDEVSNAIKKMDDASMVERRVKTKEYGRKGVVGLGSPKKYGHRNSPRVVRLSRQPLQLLRKAGVDSFYKLQGAQLAQKRMMNRSYSPRPFIKPEDMVFERISDTKTYRLDDPVERGKLVKVISEEKKEKEEEGLPKLEIESGFS